MTVIFARSPEALSGLSSAIAQERGFFARRGITLAPGRARPATAELVDAFARGSIVLASSSVETVLVAAERGADLAIIGGYRHRPYLALIAQPEVASAAELKGKIVVIGSQKGEDATLIKLILGGVGLRYPGDYELIVAASVADRVAALESGSVTAALMPPPHDLLLIEKGKKRLLQASDVVGEYQSEVLVADREWAARHPDLVVDILRASLEGARWLDDPGNEEEAVPLIARIEGMELRLARAVYKAHVQAGAMAGDLRPSEAGLRRAFEGLSAGRPASVSTTPERYLELQYLERALAAE